MATPNQEMGLSYAGYSVGGTTGKILEAWHTFQKGVDATVVQFSFLLPQITDSAAMATAVAAAEEAFRTPYGVLAITQSGSTLLSLSHSASTGFNAKPEIIKNGEICDSGRSRRYEVRITFGMPADTHGTSYRRESSVKVTYDTSNRRHLVATAVYTANGATGAYAQALSAGVTWAAAIRTALTGTWEKLTNDLERDDQDKVCTFTHTAHELVFSDGGSSDDSALVNGNLTVSRVKHAPGDFGNAKRLATLTLKYNAAVDWTVTTSLSAKFDAIRAWMVTQVQNTLGSGSLAVIEENFTPDYVNNRIDVTMTVQGTTGSNVLEATFETEDFIEEGGVLVGVWSGNKFDKYAFQGIANYVRTETATQVLFGRATIEQLKAAGATGVGAVEAKDAVVYGQEPGPQGLSNFIRVSLRPKVSVKTRGLVGNRFDVTEIVKTTVTAWYSEPTMGGGNVQSLNVRPGEGRRPGS